MGDRARFEELFREHYAVILAFCRRRLDHADADDVVAEVFTATWNRLDDVHDARARAWLYAVARNKIAQRWRANGRRSSAIGRLLDTPGVDPVPDPAELVSEADLVCTAARALSPSDLELLQLVSWEGLGPDELAIVLDCTPGTATVRVHRMRNRLQERIDELQGPSTHGNGADERLAPHARSDQP